MAKIDKICLVIEYIRLIFALLNNEKNINQKHIQNGKFTSTTRINA